MALTRVTKTGNITVDGNVGISELNPSHKLHINGGSNDEARVRVTNTANGQASLDLNNSEGYFRTYTDAGEYRIYDQTDGVHRFVIDTEGRVTTPNQPAFMTHGNAGWQVSTAGSNITFGGVAFNTSNSYNSTSHRFTAPVAGKYMFITTLYQDNTYDCRFCMTINGSQLSSFGDVIPYGYTRGPTTSGETTLSIQYIANLNLNDYVEVKQRVGYGSARVYTSHSHFGGYLIG